MVKAGKASKRSQASGKAAGSRRRRRSGGKSKIKSGQGKASFNKAGNRFKMWHEASMEAKKKLGITGADGIKLMRKGSNLYNEAKKLFEEKKRRSGL